MHKAIVVFILIASTHPARAISTKQSPKSHDSRFHQLAARMVEKASSDIRVRQMQRLVDDEKWQLRSKAIGQASRKK